MTRQGGCGRALENNVPPSVHGSVRKTCCSLVHAAGRQGDVAASNPKAVVAVNVGQVQRIGSGLGHIHGQILAGIHQHIAAGRASGLPKPITLVGRGIDGDVAVGGIGGQNARTTCDVDAMRVGRSGGSDHGDRAGRRCDRAGVEHDAQVVGVGCAACICACNPDIAHSIQTAYRARDRFV